ncbi:CheR family methyltransferase [Roseovarius confluentis]|uniref:CheR family methyltransferase n=1 Tax=Roseovarius confluentis TaxID=1852027 RepID=UPI000CDD4844|nr:protein-glutamate O-methyltransferase CheR [Roseovarius confluentis]
MNDQPHSAAPPLISSHEFATVADLIKRMTGIHISSNKRAMVSGRLAKRLKALGISSVDAYCDWLQRPGNAAEQDAFISALTTNMTRFNREDHHFTHLTDHILPGLAAAARSGRRVRLWSAACSTGEEAYDLAFRVLDACPEAARLDIRILATDIDKTALGTARAGVYPAASLSDLPHGFADCHLERGKGAGNMVRVADAPRDLVTFRCLNLNGDWPFNGAFDVIMCRNVTIYFDEDTQARLWRRLADRITPGGALYVGHSELLPEAIAIRFTQQERGAFCLPPDAPPKAASITRHDTAVTPAPPHTELTNLTPADAHRPDNNGGLG